MMDMYFCGDQTSYELQPYNAPPWEALGLSALLSVSTFVLTSLCDPGQSKPLLNYLQEDFLYESHSCFH